MVLLVWSKTRRLQLTKQLRWRWPTTKIVAIAAVRPKQIAKRANAAARPKGDVGMEIDPRVRAAVRRCSGSVLDRWPATAVLEMRATVDRETDSVVSIVVRPCSDVVR